MMALGVAAATALLAGCALPPVVDQPVLSPDGEFRGPVVSGPGVPLYAKYQGYCNLQTGRWDHGGYRAYTPKPCDRWEPRQTVRALY